jgi:hypothetical protein
VAGFGDDRRADGQARLEECAHLGFTPGFLLLSDSCCLLMWGAVSDERTGLSFAIAAGPRQRSLSRVLVP